MKHLVYIGNKLQSKGNTVTTIDTLGKQLETLGFQLSYASTKKNVVFRLTDDAKIEIRAASSSKV